MLVVTRRNLKVNISVHLKNVLLMYFVRNLVVQAVCIKKHVRRSVLSSVESFLFVVSIVPRFWNVNILVRVCVESHVQRCVADVSRLVVREERRKLSKPLSLLF
jgi:hypothetical protein